MKRFSAILLTLSAGFGFLTQDSEPEAIIESQAEPPAHFESFAPLVGKLWRGRFPDEKLYDIQEFEWMFAGKFLRNKHRVTTLEGSVVYEGETIYGWDFEAQELRWWYFNSTGGQVIGNILEEDKGYLVAEGINHGPGTQTPAVRSEMIIEKDKWVSVSFFKSGQEWKEQYSMEFREVKPKDG